MNAQSHQSFFFNTKHLKEDKDGDKNVDVSGIFLSLTWGQISAPSQLKNEQKLPKMVYIIPNFLVLHFGENFMKSKQKKQS